jgi:ubiquinone/menaquinone biosynthesis C-methylase UbiE
MSASEMFNDRGYSGTENLEAEKPRQRVFLRHCRELGGLRPHDRVLDVGCGWGFLAGALREYLGAEGTYDGIDIQAWKIQWCRSWFPTENFRFRTVDVANPNYNPRGQIKASTYRFPFPDRSFDFVVLRSVFTVMPGAEAHNYISEIARVLKPGGRCLSTLFLLNRESLRLMDPRTTRYFKHSFGFFRTEGAGGSHAVAYDETYFRVAFSIHGMKVRDPIYYGTWCGRDSDWGAQDIVVAVKEI